MTRAITEIARSALALSEQGTPGPWEAFDYTVMNGLRVVAEVNAKVDAHVIASTREAAPALAAFVLKFDQLTRDWVRQYGMGDMPSEPGVLEARGAIALLRDLRTRLGLGLDTKETK